MITYNYRPTKAALAISLISSSVEEQSAATQGIARNAQEAATGTAEVSENITNVQRAVGETGESAAKVLDASGGLAQQSEELRAKVEQFLAEIRAA